MLANGSGRPEIAVDARPVDIPEDTIATLECKRQLRSSGNERKVQMNSLLRLDTNSLIVMVAMSEYITRDEAHQVYSNRLNRRAGLKKAWFPLGQKIGSMQRKAGREIYKLEAPLDYYTISGSCVMLVDDP
nr:hypothetical protein Iba_chr03cCG12060 [Ipomoea batatas]